MRKERKPAAVDPRAAAAEAMATIDAELGRSAARRRSLFRQGRAGRAGGAVGEAYARVGDADGPADGDTGGRVASPGRPWPRLSLLNRGSPRRASGVRGAGGGTASRPAGTDGTTGIGGDPVPRPGTDHGRPAGAVPGPAGDGRPEWSPAVGPGGGRAGTAGGGRFGFRYDRPRLVARLTQKAPAAFPRRTVGPAPENPPETGEWDPFGTGRGAAPAEMEYALNDRSRSAGASGADDLRGTGVDRTRSMPETITFKRKVSPPESSLETRLRTLDGGGPAGRDGGGAAPPRGVGDDRRSVAAPSVGSNSVFESFEVAPADGRGGALVDVRHTIRHKRRKGGTGPPDPVGTIPEDPSDAAYGRFGLEVM